MTSPSKFVSFVFITEMMVFAPRRMNYGGKRMVFATDLL